MKLPEVVVKAKGYGVRAFRQSWWTANSLTAAQVAVPRSKHYVPLGSGHNSRNLVPRIGMAGSKAMPILINSALASTLAHPSARGPTDWRAVGHSSNPGRLIR